MKVKELLAKKVQLEKQKKNLLGQIDQLTSKMETQNLQKFIRTGNSSQVDGHQLDKLQRKRKHLSLLGLSLDHEILRGKKKEDERRAAKLLKKADEIAATRKRLSDRIKHFLYKVQELQKEAKIIHTEEDQLRLVVLQEGKPIREESLRLGKMEKFLMDNFILSPEKEEIEEKVLNARAHNKKILEKKRRAIDERLYQNFRIKWNKQTAKILEFEITEQPVEMLLRAENVTKQSLLREVL